MPTYLQTMSPGGSVYCTVFGNDLVRMNLSSEQIVRLLNQQWLGQPFSRILKVSGLNYVWDNSFPVGDRIVEINKDNGTHWI